MLLFSFIILIPVATLLLWHYGARINRALTLLADPWVRHKTRYQGGLQKYGDFRLPTVNHYGHLGFVFIWVIIFSGHDIFPQELVFTWMTVSAIICIGNVVENALKWLILIDIRRGVNDPWQTSFLILDTLLSWFIPIYFIGGFSLLNHNLFHSTVALAVFFGLVGISFMSYLVLGFILELKMNQLKMMDLGEK